METIQQVQLFMSLFKGRSDIYAKRWEKSGKMDIVRHIKLTGMNLQDLKQKEGNSVTFLIKNRYSLQQKSYRLI